MANQTRIGKDVLDSLTISMYENPFFIYREYIQNSADQIDIAVEQSILLKREEGMIEITIDAESRQIVIEDNATGVASLEVEAVLKNVAQSSKVKGKSKGFRGIGRLGGIAYCDKLIFETTAKGESIKSILTWDSAMLRKIINDRSSIEDAVDVIDRVTSLQQIERVDKNAHYFKVILVQVSNESLLDERQVIRYLQMVAPVCYNRGSFIFGDDIHSKLEECGLSLDEYMIYVNHTMIKKAYERSIFERGKVKPTKTDYITDVKFFVGRYKEEVRYVGWYSISEFKKKLQKVNEARGIRLRKGNIQIGSEETLTRFFKENRGNFYYFGEVLVFDKELVPNARRDYFIENERLKWFEAHLRDSFKSLEDVYRYASKVRSEVRKMEHLEKVKKEYQEAAEKEIFTNPEAEESARKKFDKAKLQAEKAEQELSKLKGKIKGSNDPKNKVYENITKKKPELSQISTLSIEESKVKYATDNLNKLNPSKKKLVREIFHIIDIVLTPDLAKNLKAKIKERFQ